ncbi:MAG: methyltransferase [Rikenellaceae bacterium]
MFHFKCFSVDDSASAMKVGTDGVLIGAWSSLDASVKRVLDVGTGSGLIALMLAQRSDGEGVTVDCVDIDEGSVAQSRANFDASPWGDRLTVYKSDFQSFEGAEKYDLIISNPPYFVDSQLPPNVERGVARHTTELTFEELVAGVVRLLNKDGRFAVILPVNESLQVDRIVEQSGCGLRLVRRCGVQNSENKPLKRYMSEYLFDDNSDVEIERDLLFIREGSPLEYSPRYRDLTADFYLKF